MGGRDPGVVVPRLKTFVPKSVTHTKRGQAVLSEIQYTLLLCVFSTPSPACDVIRRHSDRYLVRVGVRVVRLNVKIRPRKACDYPNLRSFGWVLYDKVGVLYSGKLGSRDQRHVPPISEAIPGFGGNEQSYISTKERK